MTKFTTAAGNYPSAATAPYEPSVTTHTHQTAPTQFLEAKGDRKSTRLNSSHDQISYAVFCLKKKKNKKKTLAHEHIKPLHVAHSYDCTRRRALPREDGRACPRTDSNRGRLHVLHAPGLRDE